MKSPLNTAKSASYRGITLGSSLGNTGWVAILLLLVLWGLNTPSAQAQNEIWPSVGTVAGASAGSFTLPNGVVATVSLTPGSCATSSGVKLMNTKATSAITGANFPGSWYTPTPPSTASWMELLIDGTNCNGATTGTMTITFSQPVSGLKLHFSNVDASTWTFGATPSVVSGNNVFTASGNVLHPTPSLPVNIQCQGNDGSNASGSCGTVSFSGTVSQITANIVDGSQATGIGDGLLFSMSLPDSDYDKDGVYDSVDLDDDNDGILDMYEDCTASLVTEEYQGTFGFTSACRSSNGTVTNYIYVCSPTGGVGSGGYTILNGSTLGSFNTVWRNVGGHTTTLANDAFLFANGNASAVGIFYTGTFTVVTANTYNFGCWAVNPIKSGYNGVLPNIGVRIINTTTSAVVGTVTSGNLPEGGSWQKLSTSITLSPGTYKIEMYNVSLGENGNDFAVDDISITPTTCNNDIDGDGIANQFDLDSDGDGCSDAIEGGASFTLANLVTSTLPGGNSGVGYTGTSSTAVTQNLGTTVDANGIPTIAGASGQTTGTSQDKTLKDAACTPTVIATPDTKNTAQNTPVIIPVLTNDTDNGNPATLTNVTLPVITTPPPAAQGTATVNADGTITFTPANGYTGPSTFSYKICDKADPTVCSITTVTVNITCASYSILVGELGTAANGTANGTNATEILTYGSNSATMKCSIPGGGEGIAVNPATNLAYIASANASGPYIQVYNYATGTYVASIPTSSYLLDVSKSADGAYVYASAYTSLYKISTATNTIVATMASSAFTTATGQQLWGNAVNPVTGNVYVTTNWGPGATPASQIMYVSPTLTGSPTALVTAPTGYWYRGIEFDASGNLWAVLAGQGSSYPDKLVKYNATTGAVLGTYNMPLPASYRTGATAGNLQPYDLAFGPDGNIYITTYNGDCITKFDVTTNTFSTYVPFVASAGGKTIAFVCGDVQCPSGLLAGKVWVDANKDGQLTGTETVLANVTAQLYNATTNTLLANTTTDANGYYQFTTLPAGSYYVKFTTPSGYVYTLPNVGVDATDSDANPTTGITGSYTLTAGQANTTVYAGLVAQIVANPDGATTPLNTAVNIPVLPNDNNGGTAPTASTVTTTITTPSPNGTAVVNADGTVTFTPNTGYVGTTTFTYTICDKVITTNCAATTVTVTVGCPTLVAPTLSVTSKSNVCPLTTIDLSNLTASNTPSGFTLGWFSSTPASAANRLTTVTGLAAGTYYAAFYDAASGCYGPTTPVTATVVACCAVSNTIPSLIKN